MNRRHETAYYGTFVMSAAELRIGVGVKECIRKTEVEMRKLSGTVPYTSPSCLGTISFHLGDAGNSGSGSGDTCTMVCVVSSGATWHLHVLR